LVRRHINTIRLRISNSNIPLKTKSWEHDFVGKNHEGSHRDGYYCGYCLIYNRKSGEGYALTADVKWVTIKEDDDIELKLKEFI
jgi:hypothetical protein